METILEWMNSVNDRQDLLPLWKERPIVIFIQEEEKMVPLTVNSNEIKIDHDYEFHRQVHIEGNPQNIKKMLEGKVKLTDLHPHVVHVKGKLRDLLYVESLFFLAK
ncbi:hypothetical protein GCM10010954_34510 [Halobacillus andaensis]|uniref:SCP2 domain-containing protein n=1 Tax=Halobacillus andaensis TaxID=1176239 RepID=A0A917EXY2_HALAA|nr:hypothetical protein [Halobacillus andaensis]MBP2005558.1 hypothetical protein [Halobacillus andaensis]GGF32408.1 hypothetical protein GCM10010954_34510 [Halobacillus andaensis]